MKVGNIKDFHTWHLDWSIYRAGLGREIDPASHKLSRGLWRFKQRAKEFPL
jgi:hypothetical protein